MNKSLRSFLVVFSLLAGCGMNAKGSKDPLPLPASIEAPKIVSGDCWSYSIRASKLADTLPADDHLDNVYAFCASRVANGKIEGWQVTQSLTSPRDLGGGHDITSFSPVSAQIIFNQDWSSLDTGGYPLTNRLQGIAFPVPPIGTIPLNADGLSRVDDEKVSVPGGTYNAAHLKRSALDSYGKPVQYDIWYAPAAKRDARTTVQFQRIDGREGVRVNVDLLDVSSGHALTGDPIADQYAVVAYLLENVRSIAPKDFDLPRKLPPLRPFDGLYTPRDTTNLVSLKELKDLGIFNQAIIPTIVFDQSTVGIYFGGSSELPLFPTVLKFCRTGDMIQIVNEQFDGDPASCGKHAQDYPDMTFTVEGDRLKYTGGYIAIPKGWVRVSALHYGPVYRHQSLDPDDSVKGRQPPPQTASKVTEVTLKDSQVSDLLDAGKSRNEDDLKPLGPITKITTSDRSVVAVSPNGSAKVYAPEGPVGEKTLLVTSAVGTLMMQCPNRMPYLIVDSTDRNYIRTGHQKADAKRNLQESDINSEQFAIKASNSNQPINFDSYTIKADTGQEITGISDGEGSTVRVYSCDPVQLKIQY